MAPPWADIECAVGAVGKIPTPSPGKSVIARPPWPSPPQNRSTPERHGVSSHFFCRLKKVTALTPGAANRSTPIRPRLPPFASIAVHSRFPPPLPSTKGAHNTSLGYSPRKRDIETIQGLKARSIPVPKSYGDAIGWGGAGPLALEPTGPVALGQTGRLDPPQHQRCEPCQPGVAPQETGH